LMPDRLPQRRLFGLLLLTLLAVAAAVLVAGQQVGLPLTGIDDAHIFFVYGQNLSAGHGLVYNPGGERVEGFSSPLWLLVVTLGYLLFSQPAYFLLTISIVLVAVTLAMLVCFVDDRRFIGLLGLVAIGWAVSSPAYVTWMSLALMDTALWSALLIITVILALESRRLALAVATPLLVLARPEGILWAPALIAVAALPAWVEEGPRVALRQVRSAILAYLLTLGALTLWRLWTFGYPLPNTYYVKMSPDISYNLGQGVRYLIAFLYGNPVALVGLVPAIAALLVNGRWFITSVIWPGRASGADPRLRYVAASAVVLLALMVPVYMGGDHFGNFRFFQPAWPLLILPPVALLGVLKIQAPRPLTLVAALSFVLAAFLLPRANWFNQAYRGSLAHEITVAVEGQATGRTMNALFVRETVSAGVIRAGAVASLYQGQIIDLMGLNNTTMAHAPGNRKGLKNHAAFNAEVFFNQQPAIVLPTVVDQDTQPAKLQERLAWDNAILKGLLADPRFVERYQLVTISDGQQTLLAYASQPALARLERRGLIIEAADYGVWPAAKGS
jgi:hypothetical protein